MGFVTYGEEMMTMMATRLCSGPGPRRVGVSGTR